MIGSWQMSYWCSQNWFLSLPDKCFLSTEEIHSLISDTLLNRRCSCLQVFNNKIFDICMTGYNQSVFRAGSVESGPALELLEGIATGMAGKQVCLQKKRHPAAVWTLRGFSVKSLQVHRPGTRGRAVSTELLLGWVVLEKAARSDSNLLQTAMYDPSVNTESKTPQIKGRHTPD